jgi:signal transduction histidine kinase
MIHNLLDAHRIRAGKRLPLTIERYDMKDLVDEVVKGLSLVHGDRFVVDAEPDVTGFWSWDAMRRALENLLNNAVKYGDPKAPVTIRLRATEDRKMSLSVHNQGVPLAGEDQARIFLPFERGKSAERTGARGWGIGLTLVKGIVDAHGGTVTVESNREDGTTFTIRNPMDSRSYQEDDEHG